MGFLKEKYTREYFLGKDENGNKLHYGALGGQDWEDGLVYKDIKQSLDLVDFVGKDVLDIGYGRGESARYLFNEKQCHHFCGVDFADDAYEIAKATLAEFPKEKYDIYLDDALDFLKNNNFKNKDGLLSINF